MALTNIETNIILDLYDHDLTPTKIKAIALDSNTRYVSAVIRDRGGIYDVGQNTSITLTVIRPDKVGVQITGEPVAHTETTPDEQVITTYGAYAELSLVALAVKGNLKAQFMLKSGDQILRTEIFAINCGEALDASTDTWADEYQGYNLDELVQTVQQSNNASINAYVVDEISGDVASFNDGANNIPIKSCKVNIEPVQSGSGDPSPSNVRPISGFDTVSVMRSGKNLLPTYTPETSYNGISFTVGDDGSVIATGTATATANKSSTFVAPVTGEYKLTGCPANGSGGSYQIWIRDEETGQSTGIEDRGSGSTGVLTKNKAYKVFLRINNGYTANNVRFYPMLRLASDMDDTYESYTGHTYSISLSSAGTVYGGTLDAVSGELAVDRAIVDLGSLSWGYSAPRFYSGSVTDGISPSDTGDLNAVCEKYALYETGALANQPDLSFFVNSSKMSAGTKRIVIRDSNYTDANSLKSSLNGVHLVYTLATPLTYQLSAMEIKSLLGINNIWSDAGDVEVEYRADTKLYINRLTKSDADMIADANITNGAYFMVGNNLYKATANIANGGAIIVGTNCISKSLSEALNEINV